jgi:hypothetical protein
MSGTPEPVVISTAVDLLNVISIARMLAPKAVVVAFVVGILVAPKPTTHVFMSYVAAKGAEMTRTLTPIVEHALDAPPEGPKPVADRP